MIGLLLFACSTGGLIVLLIGFAPEALNSEHNRLSLVFYLCWLALAGGSIAAMQRHGWRENLRNAVIWVTLAIALVAGYSVRRELADFGREILAAMVPGLAIMRGPGLVRVKQSNDGHFYVRAVVNGHSVRFLVDTGASMTVLTSDVALRLGFNVRGLDYSMAAYTANGPTFAAPAQLESITIGGISIENIEAAVLRPGQLDTPLLGMSFLNGLSSVRFEGDTLILHR